MRILTIIFSGLIILCVLGFLLHKEVTTNTTTVESSNSSEFFLNLPFKEVRKKLRSNSFAEDCLRANDATLIEKKWLTNDFQRTKLLSRNRHWEFKGKLLAKVRVNNTKAGTVDVDLIEDIVYANDHVDIQTHLASPLEAGITDIENHIEMNPSGDQTNVKLSNHVKLQRFIPKSFQEYAQQQMDAASLKAITNLEKIVKSLEK